MTHSKAWLSSAAFIGLVCGLNLADPNLAGGRAPLLRLGFTLPAANETQGNDQRQVQSDDEADEFAKMGNESGTQSGNQGPLP